MDFAKTQLTKFGWEEGKGLGKDETGITTAIKPKLKFDNAGLGHDGAETFTHKWWEYAFNDAANNIHVCKTENGISLNASEEFEFSAKKFSSKKKKNLVFNNFIKSATTLTNEGIEVTVEENQEDNTIQLATHPVTGPAMTDEELFNACGGRTAHKGARHGLGLNGKLARVEEQERKALAMISIDPVVAAVSGKKKKKKSKKTSVEPSSQDEADLQDDKPMVNETRGNDRKSKKKEGIFPTKEMAEASNEENSPKKRKKSKLANVIEDRNDDVEENIMKNKNPATFSNSEIVALEAIPDTDNTMLDGTSVKLKKIKSVKGSHRPTHCESGVSVEETYQAESCPKKRKKNKSNSGIEDNEDNNEMHDDTKEKRKKSKKVAPTSSDSIIAMPIDLPIEATKFEDIPKKHKKRKSVVGMEDPLNNNIAPEDSAEKIKNSKKIPATSSDAETSEVGLEKRKKKKKKYAGVGDEDTNHVNCVGNNDNNPDVESGSDIIVKKQKKSKRKHNEIE